MKKAWISLAAVCALVVGVYAYTAHSGLLESLSLNAGDHYYNLLVQGFRAGHLSLKKEVPPGLAQLADPYDPTANEVYRGPPYRLHDLSYYKGRLYLYFGVTPALILFWPVVALTGHYLSHRLAVLIFCTMGFLASGGVLCATWRRYFSDVSVWVVAAGTLALGLATLVPVMLPRSAYNEVAISCGYMLTMLALGAIWSVLHQPERRCWWLAAASVAYGLAVGARPTLLFGAIILLVPVIHAWREGRRVWMLLVAATAPIAIVGLGLMLYNALRFDSPFEFGQHYQLAQAPSRTCQYLHPRFFWFNFRVYFLEPARWSGSFPFVHEIARPPLPAGYDRVENPFGILTNIPFVWLAAAVPLAWRGRSGPEASMLRWFSTAAALLFGICALTVALYWSAVIRYEVDFAPVLVPLAVVGLLGLERTMADRPVRRRAARWGWGLLLGFSVAFNLLASVEPCANAHYELGLALDREGQLPNAVREYRRAVRLMPNYAQAYNNLGVAAGEVGNYEEAIRQFEQALQIRPAFAEAHYNLGNALVNLNKASEAVGEYKLALQAVHNYPDALHNLAVTLVQLGRLQEAVGYFEELLRINPNDASGWRDFGVALLQAGRYPDAIGQLEQALRIDPNDAEAHYDLGVALAQSSKVPEAIVQYEQALRLKPDFTEAQKALARLQARQ
jgi:tetratricopeptide (TPR) repeat protein